jgi:hypothetical protein
MFLKCSGKPGVDFWFTAADWFADLLSTNTTMLFPFILWNNTSASGNPAARRQLLPHLLLFHLNGWSICLVKSSANIYRSPLTSITRPSSHLKLFLPSVNHSWFSGLSWTYYTQNSSLPSIDFTARPPTSNQHAVILNSHSRGREVIPHYFVFGSSWAFTFGSQCGWFWFRESSWRLGFSKTTPLPHHTCIDQRKLVRQLYVPSPSSRHLT